MASDPPGHRVDDPAGPVAGRTTRGLAVDRERPTRRASPPVRMATERRVVDRDAGGAGTAAATARPRRLDGSPPTSQRERLAHPAGPPRDGRPPTDPSGLGGRATGAGPSERAAAAAASDGAAATSAEPRDDRVLVEEARVEIARHERRLGQDRRQQVEVGLDALDPGPVQRVRQRVDRRRRGPAPWAIDLGQQRVVVRRDGRRPRAMPVSTRTPSGRSNAVTTAGRRQEARRRVLGHDPHLDRVPVEPDVGLREPERLARRDPQLLLDEVEARDRLGDRVLDLQPRVDLEEEERARLVEQELDGARVPVAGRPRQPQRRLAHRRPRRGRHRRRRRLLDELLVPALDAALALAEVDQRPERVAQHLDLHVPRPLHVALEQQPVVAERRRAPRGAPPPAPRAGRRPRGRRASRDRRRPRSP